MTGARHSKLSRLLFSPFLLEQGTAAIFKTTSAIADFIAFSCVIYRRRKNKAANVWQRKERKKLLGNKKEDIEKERNNNNDNKSSRTGRRTYKLHNIQSIYRNSLVDIHHSASKKQLFLHPHSTADKERERKVYVVKRRL